MTGREWGGRDVRIGPMLPSKEKAIRSCSCATDSAICSRRRQLCSSPREEEETHLKTPHPHLGDPKASHRTGGQHMVLKQYAPQPRHLVGPIRFLLLLILGRAPPRRRARFLPLPLPHLLPRRVVEPLHPLRHDRLPRNEFLVPPRIEFETLNAQPVRRRDDEMDDQSPRQFDLDAIGEPRDPRRLVRSEEVADVDRSTGSGLGSGEEEFADEGGGEGGVGHAADGVDVLEAGEGRAGDFCARARSFVSGGWGGGEGDGPKTLLS